MTTTAWKDPTAFKTGGTGDVAWTAPENIATDDDVYAQGASALSGNTTEYCQGYTYDFSEIPSGSTINGLEVRIQKHRTVGFGSPIIADHTIQLRTAADTFTGDNKADTVSDWPGADLDIYFTYGGSADKWSVALTSALVQDPEFGVGVRAQETVGPADEASALLDHVQMRIYYDSPGGGGGGAASFPPIVSKW